MPLQMPPVGQDVQGRIKSFDNLWNGRQVEVINKEDKLRWASLDRQMEIRASHGMPRKTMSLPRSHSSIGPFPGGRRLTELSPRKSASVCLIEQRLLGSSHQDPSAPSTRERLYTGVSHEEGGRHDYLKRRARVTVQERFGGVKPLTSNMTYGFHRPEVDYRASKFCHKPIIDESFYRVSGTTTHMNLPQAQH